MTNPTYKGIPVTAIERNDALMTFVLYDKDGNLIAEIPEFAFLSNPALKRMSLNGRHRRARPKTQSHSPATPGPGNPGAAFAPAGTLTLATLLAIKAKLAGWPKPYAFSANGPVEDAGIRAGEIVAHRAWRVTGDELRSVYISRHVWQPGIPARGNIETAGVHAFNEQAGAVLYAMADREVSFHRDRLTGYLESESAARKYVIGTVELWGDVIEHERGYRAEFAAIRSLTHGIGIKDLDPLRIRYCTTFDLPDEFVRVHRRVLDHGLGLFAERRRGDHFNIDPIERMCAPCMDVAPDGFKTLITVTLDRDPETGNFIVRPTPASRPLIAEWCARNSAHEEHR